LSIMVVLVGVAICTVSDVSVNAKGFVAAVIAVWSTALQQYVRSHHCHQPNWKPWQTSHSLKQSFCPLEDPGFVDLFAQILSGFLYAYLLHPLSGADESLCVVMPLITAILWWWRVMGLIDGSDTLWATLIRLWQHSFSCLCSNCSCGDFSAIS
jgi:hypothetical protein